MQFIPTPGRGELARLAALVILLVVVILLSPAIVAWSVIPVGREFLLRLLAELRSWSRDLIQGTSSRSSRRSPSRSA